MKSRARELEALLLILMTLALGSCGGGTSGDASPTARSGDGGQGALAADQAEGARHHPRPPVTICGTVATGAALAGATITLTDATGTTVGTTTSRPDGTFSVTPSRTAVAPFVLTAVSSDTTLVSMVPDSSTPVVDITSLTNLMASLLSSTGDPVQLVKDITTKPAVVSRAAIETVEAQVATLVRPVSTALGVFGTNYIGERFVANGLGLDRLLDSLDITIRPTGPVADIQLSIRERLADGAQPIALVFTSATVPTSVDYTVEAQDLIPAGLSAQILQFVDQLTACYAEPVTTRSSGTQVVGPACTALFYNGDATTYLNSGNTVSPTGAFEGIFSAGATGATFADGTYLYTRTVALPGGGTASAPVVRVKSVGPTGNTSYFVVSLVAQAGALVLLGDQYPYSGTVYGLSQLRQYVNEPAANFISTGLSYNVNNQTSTNGGVTTPIFARVVVTLAGATQYTLLPTNGYGYLVLQEASGSASSTNIVRLASAFLSSSTTSSKGSPSAFSSGLVYASPALTDAQIAALPDQSSVRYDYFLAGNASATPDSTQYYRTQARPFTLAEFTAYIPQLPSLVSPSPASLVASTLGVAPNLYFAPPASGPITFGWSVPSGAPPVSSINLFGYVPGIVNFNDNTSGIGSTASTASVYCQAQTSSDPHCTAAGNYVGVADLYGIQFQAPNSSATNLQDYYLVANLY